MHCPTSDALSPSKHVCNLSVHHVDCFFFYVVFLFYFETQPCFSLPGLCPALAVVIWSFNFVRCFEQNFEL